MLCVARSRAFQNIPDEEFMSSLAPGRRHTKTVNVALPTVSPFSFIIQNRLKANDVLRPRVKQPETVAKYYNVPLPGLVGDV
jgi:hypothetical protein